MDVNSQVIPEKESTVLVNACCKCHTFSDQQSGFVCSIGFGAAVILISLFGASIAQAVNKYVFKN